MLRTLVFLIAASALNVDFNSRDSVLAGAEQVAHGLMDYYDGNNTGKSPGMFTAPYYWWEAGVAWGTMLEYGYWSGNETYLDLVHSSLLFQSGDFWNYMVFNQTSTEGNDDQGFWGLTVMAAAEKNFTKPGKGYPSSWLYFAQATFNSMANRWDTGTCGGGLRWQIYTWNSGYTYKNLVSNGCLFNLAARLYRYTNNDTFLDWSEKVFDWLWDLHFINNTFPAESPQVLGDGSPDYAKMTLFAYDGAGSQANCSTIAPYEWTYNQALMISGCAALYNKTGNKVWLSRMKGLYNRAKVFFHKGEVILPQNAWNTSVLYEAACQQAGVECNVDQRCFKGIFARLVSLSMQLVPEAAEWFAEPMLNSAKAAANSCSGGRDGHTCGQNWFNPGWDGIFGLGEQISALDTLVVQLQRFSNKPAVLTAKDVLGSSHNSNETNRDGSSVYGYPDAGLNSSSVTAKKLRITNRDIGGAAALTAIVMVLLIAGSAWLLF